MRTLLATIWILLFVNFSLAQSNLKISFWMNGKEVSINELTVKFFSNNHELKYEKTGNIFLIDSIGDELTIIATYNDISCKFESYDLNSLKENGTIIFWISSQFQKI